MNVEITHTQTSYLTAVDDLPGALQSETKLQQLLTRVEEQARAHVPDTTTEAGRKAIASNAYRVARSKTAIDAAGKELGDEFRRKLNAVNAVRKAAVDRLDALQAEVRSPLTEWEEADKRRIAAHERRLKSLTVDLPLGARSDVIQAEVDRLKAIPVDEDTWDEFAATAAEARKLALSDLETRLGHQKDIEDQQAELLRMREELAARRAEDERRAAEEAAQAEAERHRQEAARIEEERKAAEQRAAQAAREAAEREAAEKIEAARREAEAAAERERQAEIARQRAEEDALAARQRAEDEAKAAAIAAEREAEERAARAVAAEQARAAEERRLEMQAAAARARDEAHRAKVRREIDEALVAITRDEALAATIRIEIWEGRVPNVRVEL